MIREEEILLEGFEGAAYPAQIDGCSRTREIRNPKAHLQYSQHEQIAT
jgi:hypothetical protein